MLGHLSVHDPVVDGADLDALAQCGALRAKQGLLQQVPHMTLTEILHNG